MCLLTGFGGAARAADPITPRNAAAQTPGGRPTFESFERTPFRFDDDTYAEGKPRCGLQCDLRRQRRMWTRDSIDVEFFLKAVDDLTFELLSPEFMLILTRNSRGPVVTRVSQPLLSWQTGKNMDEKPVKYAATDRIGYSRIDLREHFGNLAPGKYTIQVLFPKSSYRVTGGPTAGEDVPSQEVELELFDTHLKLATAANKPRATGIGLEVLKVKSDEDQVMVVDARLTNRLSEDISFYKFPHKNGAPVRVPGSFLDTWRPPGVWDRPLGAAILLCGTGLTSHTLAPGKSVTLELHARVPNGIHYYCVDGCLPKRQDSPAWVARSEPFVADRTNRSGPTGK